MSEYNRAVLNREKIYSGNLLLVNADHPLRSREVNGLSSVDMRFPGILLRRDAANILRLILKKISAGAKIVPVSGYRSSEEQTEIYENSLKENGREFTKKFVALPDRSEHQTGLAIDLGLKKEKIDFICPDFPYEGICETFREAAPEYGFIERYAKEKEQITGISHEPWHFRYVGYPHSEIMAEKGLSLEEYVDFIKAFGEENKYCCRQGEIEVYYVPASEEGDTEILISSRAVYQISGNNADGFIVTAWKRGKYFTKR